MYLTSEWLISQHAGVLNGNRGIIIYCYAKSILSVISAEMGLISPAGENLLDFLELRQVLSTYDGDLRDPLWWPQERPVPMRVTRGPLGIPHPSMPVPKTLCGVGARP